VFFVLLIRSIPLSGQQNIEVSGFFDWEKQKITVTTSLDLNEAHIRLPTGRVQAERMLESESVYFIRPFLLAMPVDSAHTVQDKVNLGELSLQQIDAIARSAQRSPSVLSSDLKTMQNQYIIDISIISAALIRHKDVSDIFRVLIPNPAPAYSGIIIIADKPLPIHGRMTRALAVPALFPKIWDTDMNLIYERNNIDPTVVLVSPIVHYVPTESIFRNTPSGMDAALLKKVGPNPLRILARGVFGIKTTDILIDPEDARLIISTEENRQLLREGKVTIVLNSDVLSSNFQRN
jgi:hypothetical protein